jgi:hypothetical protein
MARVCEVDVFWQVTGEEKRPYREERQERDNIEVQASRSQSLVVTAPQTRSTALLRTLDRSNGDVDTQVSVPL